MRALSLRNGHWRRASSAAGGEAQLAGGSTTRSACRSRHRRAATSKVDSPTSRSRVSGGMAHRVELATPSSSNNPVALPLAGVRWLEEGGAPPTPPGFVRGEHNGITPATPDDEGE